MPQKLNKAGKMQDYIPAGNGDPSGEYGTAKGTNKNFTTSDKKKTEANVITENKSVVVGDKGKETKKDFWQDKIDRLEKTIDGLTKADAKGNKKPIEDLEKELQDARFNKDLVDAYKELEELEKSNKDGSLDSMIESKKNDMKNIEDNYKEWKKTGLNVAQQENRDKQQAIKDSVKKDMDAFKTKANVIDGDLTKGVDKGKSATRKDKYGNPLVSDEAFKVGYEAGKKYLDEMTKYYDKDKLLMSNVFLGYLNSEINKGIEEAGLDENYDMTYQDANEIIGSLLNVNVDMEEYERGFTPSKVYKGGKYTGYKPKGL